MQAQFPKLDPTASQLITRAPYHTLFILISTRFPFLSNPHPTELRPWPLSATAAPSTSAFPSLSQTPPIATLREVSILRRTDSPHVIRCHGVFDLPGGDIAICMEYMDAGTLDTLLKEKSVVFTERLLSQICRQVLGGLEYLHAHKIIHRDLKPSNILVNRAMEVKISDFGVSKVMQRTLDPCNSYVGTCAYMSPERFDPDTYGSSYDGYAGDIWSLGLTLLELYVGHFPYLEPGQRPDWATLMCAICFGEPPSLPEGTSEDFRSFIECCLQKDSSKRWSAKQLLTHPFVRGVEPK
ncbi:Mitogen-activated protein kinase kinase 9 [Striga hermonthica]|uniref:mitogen-activated protein kinase kinase n=1 Tax=Striga hermonthica TaxID=68872 RepID=A0A9N7NKS1_STRHE|nr:Mitogen-activated protein kinase kinase 9 [Striga hermonthica]